jgi:hypothetical protein
VEFVSAPSKNMGEEVNYEVHGGKASEWPSFVYRYTNCEFDFVESHCVESKTN